jgi:hypothetical protein
MKNKFKNIALAILVLTLSSCVSDANFRAYVYAHRLSYDVTSVHYKSFLADLPPADQATHLRRVEAENSMITKAEKLLGIKQ